MEFESPECFNGNWAATSSWDDIRGIWQTFWLRRTYEAAMPHWKWEKKRKISNKKREKIYEIRKEKKNEIWYQNYLATKTYIHSYLNINLILILKIKTANLILYFSYIISMIN